MPLLSDLPVDLQIVICSILRDVSPQSFRALSRVNRAYHEVAASFLYRGLKISLSSRAGLLQDVSELRESDVGKKFLQSARQLELTGYLHLNESEREVAREMTHKPFQPVDDSFSAKESLNPRFGEVFVGDARVYDREGALEAWKPFVSLISDFQRLTDVVYSSRNRFPPGLLEAIQQYHPTCRVHLRVFRFQSLNEELTDPDEYALVKSPLLHSLSILYTWRDSAGADDFNGEAALRVVSLAPNLEHVRMLGCRPASSPQLYAARNRERGQWKDFMPPTDRFEKASLQSLSFCVYQNQLSKKKFDQWAAYTDFSKLQEIAFSVQDGIVLMDIAVNDRFPSLSRLEMTLERRRDDEAFKEAAETFFSNLRPLEVLRLSGTLHRELLEKIFERHGSALREMSLNPYEDYYDMAGPPYELTPDDIAMIASNCHALSQIGITIRRSMSNREETKCYEALGRIQTLTDVFLKLDCSNPSSPGPPREDWDDFNKTRTDGGMWPRLYNGHLEYAIVNSAVDQTLAQSIWDVISEDNPKLQTLMITTRGGSGFGNSHPGDLMNIVENLARSWKLTRSGSGDAVDVVELTKDYREDRDKRQREHEQVMLEKWGHRGTKGSSYTVFNRLWPRTNDDDDWREAWHSWPLQRGE